MVAEFWALVLAPWVSVGVCGLISYIGWKFDQYCKCQALQTREALQAELVEYAQVRVLYKSSGERIHGMWARSSAREIVRLRLALGAWEGGSRKIRGWIWCDPVYLY